MRAPTTTTLREAWEVWIEAARKGEIRNRNRRAYKPAALRSYDNDMALYVLPGYGARRLADIRPDDIQHLVDRLVGAGKSGSRVRNVVVPLQALYRRHRREVPVNPTRDLDLPEAGGVREWSGTPAEAHAKLAALPAGDRALWATAFFAGLRRGELRALRVSDVHGLADSTEAYLDVSRNWDDQEGEIAPKSTAGTRRVPIPETLRAQLFDHVTRTKRDGDDFIFGPRDGRRSPRATSAPRPTERGEVAGVSRVTLHECRHGYASFLDARDQRRLGLTATSVTPGRRSATGTGIASEANWGVTALSSTPTSRGGRDVIALPRTGAQSGAQSRHLASFSGRARAS